VTTPTSRSSARRVTALGSAAALAASGAGMVAVVGTSGPAAASDLVVTTCADSGPGSLRDAISQSETAGGADTITITAICTGPSAVPVGSVMTVTQSLTVTGPGAASFVLDGGGANGVLEVRGDSTTVFALSGVTVTHSYAVQSAVTALDVDSVTVSGVAFVDDQSTYYGGGLTVDGASGAVTVTASSFVGNLSGAPIRGGAGFFGSRIAGPIGVTSSLFTGNQGYRGAAVAIQSSTGDLTIANTTITGNVGDSTGALYGNTTGDITVLFSTVTDNTANSGAGGLYALNGSAALEIVGSIFSGNSNSQVSSGGRTVTSSDNIIHGTVNGFTPDATDLDVDPELAALADNGGPTQTRALAATSPAVGHGPAVVPEFPGNVADQRGLPYVRVYGGRADAGAYELQPDPAPEPGPTPDPEPTPEPTFTG